MAVPVLADGTIDPVTLTFEVGTYTFTWTVTDASGTPHPCVITITVVDDQDPTIECPPSFTVPTEFNQTYAQDVDIPEPFNYGDNCDYVITWAMTGATTDVYTNYIGIDGEEFVPTPYPQLNVGVTTITYTITDPSGNFAVCSFTITVLGAPVITCPDDYTTNTDPGVCTATRNSGTSPDLLHYGLPTLQEGVHPIVWTWTITNPDGSEGATGTYDEEVTGINGPPVIPDYPFELGESVITWRAENLSGSDECTHLVIVEDKEPPTFTSAPITNCVDRIQWATYTNGSPSPEPFNRDNLILFPNPDGYTFVAGNITLDLTNLDDNCCTPADPANPTDINDPEHFTINWTITFVQTPDPDGPAGALLTHTPISGTGQPSDYGSDIYMPGDGINFTTVTHTITYTVTDCHGNVAATQTQNIEVTPRPKIEKM
jgi:hypothetical protein